MVTTDLNRGGSEVGRVLYWSSYIHRGAISGKNVAGGPPQASAPWAKDAACHRVLEVPTIFNRSPEVVGVTIYVK